MPATKQVSAAEYAAIAKIEGFVPDEKIPISVRYWEGIRRRLVAMMSTCTQLDREADEMLARVVHIPGCKGAEDNTWPCDIHCPDRELRLSALAIKTNVAQHIDGTFKLPKADADGLLLPPSREFMDRIISELEFYRAQGDWKTSVKDFDLSVEPDESASSIPPPPALPAITTPAPPPVEES